MSEQQQPATLRGVTAIITLKKVGFLVREVWGTQLRVKKLRAHFHVLCTAGPYEIVGSNPVKDKKILSHKNALE